MDRVTLKALARERRQAAPAMADDVGLADLEAPRNLAGAPHAGPDAGVDRRALEVAIDRAGWARHANTALFVDESTEPLSVSSADGDRLRRR